MESKRFWILGVFDRQSLWRSFKPDSGEISSRGCSPNKKNAFIGLEGVDLDKNEEVIGGDRVMILIRGSSMDSDWLKGIYLS